MATKETVERKLGKAYKVKVTPEVAAAIKGKSIVTLKMAIWPKGSRLLLVEWNGGPIGRADFCTVLGVEGDRLVLDRRFCWGQGKLDEDLTQLSYAIEPGESPLVTKAAL